MTKFIEWIFGAESGELAGQASDWRIAFVSQYNNYARMALLMVLAAMIYLTIRSYLREGEVKRSVKMTLAAIRIAVIVLAFGVLFQPAMVLRYTKDLTSTVVVLLDDSLSMGFKDRYAEAAEAQPLAESLGVRPEQLSDLTRTEIVRRQLDRPDGPLMTLKRDHPVALVAFSTDQPAAESYVRRLGATIDEVVARGRKNDPAAPTSAPANVTRMLAELSAKGFETNLPQAVREAVDKLLQGKRGCLVVIGDGRQTSEGAAGRLAGAREYALQRGYPIYTVTVGDPIPPKNIAVVGLQAPREVSKDSTVLFSARLAHRGLAGQSLIVKLQRRKLDGRDWTDVTSQSVRLEGAEGAPEGGQARGEQAVEISAAAEEIGEFLYRATVEPRGDEQNVNDNAAESPVKVTDKKIKVLLVSGDAGHEFQYLKSYLLSQPELYAVSVWQENADPEVNQAASSKDMKLTQFPHSLEMILGAKEGGFPGYDVIVLYDPQPTQKGFDKAFVENLKTAVDTHGRGLCYIVGNKYSASVLGAAADFQAMRDLLPVAINPREVPEMLGERRPEPWPAVVTGYGMEHPVMRLTASLEENRKLWEGMPGIFWSHSLVRVKPTARILAEHSNPARRVDRGIAEPLVVAMPFGRGRVLYTNFDETWRWRLVKDQLFYKAFWGNVMKYLAPSATRQVIITTGGERFSAGERITVEIEAYDEAYNPLKEKDFTVRMTDKATGDKQDIVLEAVSDKPGRYKGVIPRSMTTHVGVYELTAPGIDPEKTEPKEIRIELPQAEMIRPEADPATMQNLASKGEFALGAHQIDRLAEVIPEGRMRQMRDVPRELWDTHLTILLIVALLAAEWILRKKHNMA